jgi:DNA-binding CsgD family transcriptional regulator
VEDDANHFLAANPKSESGVKPGARPRDTYCRRCTRREICAGVDSRCGSYRGTGRVAHQDVEPTSLVDPIVERWRRARQAAAVRVSARLVAEGLTTREIADRLYISPKTADHHIQHVYTKIGVSNRAAAALWAFQHDVID